MSSQNISFKSCFTSFVAINQKLVDLSTNNNFEQICGIQRYKTLFYIFCLLWLATLLGGFIINITYDIKLTKCRNSSGDVIVLLV